MTTKVTAEGHVLVVGINKYGTEVFKLYMNEDNEKDDTAKGKTDEQLAQT